MSYRLVAARAGARVLRCPAWLRTVRASSAVAALRADRARTVLEVAGVLALAARADSTAAPTWPVLIEGSGYSRATVARVLAWLREARLLVTLENGSTPQFRPDPAKQRWRRDRPAPVPVEGNRAAVYLLTEPLPEPPPEPEGTAKPSEPVDQWRRRTHSQPSEQVNSTASGIVIRLETPPHLSRRERLKNNPARADARVEPPPDSSWSRLITPKVAAVRCAAGKTAQKPGGRSHLRDTRGRRRAAALAVAEQLRARALDLRPLSAAAVRSVIRDLVQAGWEVEDFVWAIDHTPDGKTRTYTAGPAASSSLPRLNRMSQVGADHIDHVEQFDHADHAARSTAERRRRGIQVDGGARVARAVAYPAAWLRWRLAPWAGLAGPVAASRTAAMERSVAARAAAAQRREAAVTARLAATPPPVAYLQARRALRASRGLRQGLVATGDEPAVADPRTPAGSEGPAGSASGSLGERAEFRD